MARKKILSVALATLLTMSTVCGRSNLYGLVPVAKAQAAEDSVETVVDATEVDSNEYGLADEIQDGVILHCFDWKYSDIKAELPNIAKAGFTSVQTSPAQKGDGSVWYWLYQPQTFSIQPNALGDKAELTALCEEAEKYGIKIVVDVVANHTRAVGDDGLGGDCYHNTGQVPGEAYNEGKRYEITHNRIGMPDLASENATVQNKVAGYIDELKSVGVDGIRWDAAKHIDVPSEFGSQFWPKVTAQGLWHYGEILDGPANGHGNNDAIMKEYTQYMTVTDDEFGNGYLNAVNGGGVPSAIGNYTTRGIAKNKLMYWAESHDTYSNNGEYGKATQYIDENKIDKAYALLAGQGQASTLYFSRPFEKTKESIKAGVKGSTHFTEKEVAAVNHLHNACVGQKDYIVSEGNTAAVCRETGAVVVGQSGQQVTISNGGGLTAPGTYKDEVSGNEWTVTADKISGKLSDKGISAFYTEGNGGGTVTKKASVSASVADGSTFTDDTMDVTLTVKNATSATYSVDGGEEKTISSTATVKVGAGVEVGATTTITVKATGEDGETVTKTFSYKKTEAAAVKVNTVYLTLPSGWSNPCIYVYANETGVNGMKWETAPAMTDEGNGVYSYTFDSSVSSCQVIFKGSGQQIPAAEQPGFKYESGKAYSYDGAWKELSVSTPKTPAPNTPVVEKTPVVSDDSGSNNDVTPAPGTPDVVGDVSINADKANNAEFKTETMDVTITLSGATEGTYSVDNGPVKSFTSSAKVTVGQGMIADKTTSIKVTAKNGSKTEEKTFTYKKVFDKENAVVKSAAVSRIKNLEEIIMDLAQVEAEAETGGMYSTNPSGKVGKRGTITIDGDCSDWSEDMLIAQCGAWDIANNFKGGHENCVLDDYALYAAWDDTNLYLGCQMVNTTDTWANSGEGPLSDGGRVLDVPLIFAINVGNRNAMTGATTDGKGIWGLDLSFKTRVDNILVMSGKPGLGTPGYFTGNDAGVTDYKEHCLSFKDEGIAYKMAEDSLPEKILMLTGEGLTPADVYDASKYVDAMSKGHDRKYDSFYEINIPLKTLGIDSSYIESEGIGVMQIATRGVSAIDCIPHDPSMLDNATGDCAVDPSTSHEKDDADEITVPLAAVGKLGGNANSSAGGEVSGGNGNSGSGSDNGSTTVTPVPSDDNQNSGGSDVKPTPVVSDDNGGNENGSNSGSTTGKYTVNFGADRSAPQLNTTELTLKAIPYNGEGEYTYKFSVDGTTIQDASSADSCKWKGTKGTHKIKVEVTDKSGNKITSEKDYVIEEVGTVVNPTPSADNNAPTSTAVAQTPRPNTSTNVPVTTDNGNNGNGNNGNGNTNNTVTNPPIVNDEVTEAPQQGGQPTPQATVLPTATVGPSASPAATAAANSQGDIDVSVVVISDTESVTVGSTNTIKVTATGGTEQYKYTVKITKPTGVTEKLVENGDQAEQDWKPSAAGTYKITATVVDNAGNTDTAKVNCTVKNNVSIKVAKAGKKIKFTTNASGTGTLKYAYKVYRTSNNKLVASRKFSKSKSYSVRLTKKGKYKVKVQVKSADGSVLTKTKNFKLS